MQKRRLRVRPAHEVVRRSFRIDTRRVLVVSGIALLALVAVISATSPALAATAHADADDPLHVNPDCKACHKPHTAPTKRSLLAGADESAVCYTCHDDAVASDWNIETGAANSFDTGTSSGHSLEEDNDTVGPVDLTNSCTACHGVHGDPDLEANLPANEMVAGTTIDPTKPRSWCLSCHNADHAWYAGFETGGVFGVNPLLKSTYDARIQSPSRDTSHYPVFGTFPGPASYTVSSSVHASIPTWEIESAVNPGEPVTRVAGDCLWCHESHRSDAPYDGLLAEYGPSDPTDTTTGTYAQACFECHGNSSEGTTGEIYASTNATPLDNDYWAAADANGDTQGAPDIYELLMTGGATSGHRILTDGAYYAAGSPLPCYECHNPHGSTNGNSAMFSDALGADLDTSTAEGVRRFCFTCHTSYDIDLATGRPYGWDSTAADYVPVAADAKIVDLARNASAATEENRLRLWQVSTGHDHDDTQDCLAACHGDVHAPMGAPVGATNCFDSSCHSALHGMVDDVTSYHHVLDAASPDQPPADGVYPTFSSTTQELSCVSCHMDHTAWESLGNSYNLRSDALVGNPTASNTDEGLCMSCHSYTLPFRIFRSAESGAGIIPTPPGQANNALPATAVMRVEDDYWADSPHNYPTDTYFTDGSKFVGNCAKCHGTLEEGQYTATTPYSFTVHYSPEQRLLNALGQNRSSLPAPQTAAINEEDMCFRCHSNSTDKLDLTTEDYYGTRPMSTANRAIGMQMDPVNNIFGHKPASYYKEHPISSIDEPQSYLGTVTGGVAVNKHVECADCHNHHIVGKSRHIYGTTNLVSDAIQGVRGVGFTSDASGDIGATLQTLATQNYPSTINYAADGVGAELEYKQMATYEYEVCFKCHSSANENSSGVSALPAWGSDMVWDYWNGSAWAVGTNAAVDNWTNVAQDFNVGNNSRHPVLATLGGFYYESRADYEFDLANGFATDSKVQITGYATDPSDARTTSLFDNQQVSNGWSQGDTMVCSDCHGDSRAPYAMVWDSATSTWKPNSLAEDVPQGPHGASVRFSLRGPHTSWPTWGPAAAPYGYEGQLITLSTMATLQAGNPILLNSGGVFCSNCHPAAKVRDNIVHRKGAHANYPCIRCHILVPHGGKVSRLIGDAQTMDPRLAYQGSLSNMWVSGFRKRVDPSTYVLADCAVSTNNVGCSGGASKHTANNSPTGVGMENW